MSGIGNRTELTNQKVKVIKSRQKDVHVLKSISDDVLAQYLTARYLQVTGLFIYWVVCQIHRTSSSNG